MALKQDFATRSRPATVWQAQIREHQERMKETGARAQADTETAIAQLQEQVEQARKLVAKVQQANEAVWQDVQSANRKAFEQLQRGWGEALKRFV